MVFGCKLPDTNSFSDFLNQIDRGIESFYIGIFIEMLMYPSGSVDFNWNHNIRVVHK